MIAPLLATVALVSPCTTRDIHSFNGMLQGATGTMDGSLSVRNVSSVRCLLGGRPAVRIRTHAGRILATKQEAFTNAGGRTVTTLAPRHVAVLHLDWSNWCGAWPGPVATEIAVHLQVMLASRRTLVLPVRTGRPRGDRRAAPSRLFVSPFVNS